MASGKDLARQYINGRAAKREPVQSIGEIRRQIGWELIEAERETRAIEYELPAVLKNQAWI